MRKVLRIIIAMVGIGIGCGVFAWVLYSFKCPGYDYVLAYTTIPAVMAALYVIVGILFGIIFFILSPKIIDGIHGFFQKLEHRLTEMPALDILFGVIGIMIGMVFAFLLSLIMRTIEVPVLPEVITLLLFLICGYYGGHIGLTRRAELMDGYARRGHLAKGIAASSARHSSSADCGRCAGSLSRQRRISVSSARATGRWRDGGSGTVTRWCVMSSAKLPWNGSFPA